MFYLLLLSESFEFFGSILFVVFYVHWLTLVLIVNTTIISFFLLLFLWSSSAIFIFDSRLYIIYHIYCNLYLLLLFLLVWYQISLIYLSVYCTLIASSYISTHFAIRMVKIIAKAPFWFIKRWPWQFFPFLSILRVLFNYSFALFYSIPPSSSSTFLVFPRCWLEAYFLYSSSWGRGKCVSLNQSTACRHDCWCSSVDSSRPLINYYN